ncbi:hypothetical protein NA57DRAFT_66204 [Rhizodiscina lignyota]|uniref:Phosphoribosyltransferase domain-containing protein n=1 Tax=Rhizodiscina lignyota TaxID=1504668 RepID=A0A9P4M960_9PEZI|nr:hypothetical protein NA57DRAFT_66204 [Rhizodiscina lignyota]
MPIVIGLYGIPGSGKTFLLSQLKHELGQGEFAFYEGSKVIGTLFAIDTIRNECIFNGKAAVVTGHFMFWPEEEDSVPSVLNQNDMDTFTHILYLDVPPETVVQRRINDTTRDRPSVSATHLRKWLEAEQSQLRDICREHEILFLSVSMEKMPLSRMLAILHDFRHHDENHNMSKAINKLEEEDAGKLFWESVSGQWKHWANVDRSPLKSLFSSPLGYSYTAFRQASLLYEQAANDEGFEWICRDVEQYVTMHSEFALLLGLVQEQPHVGVAIVTCGLRRVWEILFAKAGLLDRVTIIGGGRIKDEFVVTPQVKAALVSHLQEVHKLKVWAFGDSPLDLEMMKKADQAVVVTGDEKMRSRTMDAALENAIGNTQLRALQVLLPKGASPRLNTVMLPTVSFTDPNFLDAILRRHHRQTRQVLHATDRNAAKLLMTPMRDARVAGPQLREAHRRVGWYLGTEFLAEAVDTEEYSIPHVQGNETSGYRLTGEEKTLIVALMRGGEPMAFGVSDAFPPAMLLHARGVEDVKEEHLQERHNVVLVDSVVNSSDTVVQFVEHIRALHPAARIVVVTGVVQAECLTTSTLAQLLVEEKLCLVALRISDNKYTGKGTTDTGNRLLNTTQLP